MANIFSERINALRAIMERNGWEAVVISGSDPHSSEYPAPRWQQVKFLSGFTGEAGDMVVTMDHAGLWTDSRYFVQALDQLQGTGVELHKTRLPETVTIPQWLSGKVKVVAVDGLCWNADVVKEISDALGEGGLVVDVPDILDELWEDRPRIPVTPIATLDVATFGGIPRMDKITWLRKWMLIQGVDRVLVSSLDEIAWILNVRGRDIDYNPLVISYLLVSQDYVKWFVRKPECVTMPQPDTEDSFQELAQDGVDIEDYSAVFFAISDFTDEGSPVKIFADPSSLNYHLYCYIRDSYAESDFLLGKSPIILEKAVKCPSEIENLRQTYIYDGAALTAFLYWLETEVGSGKEIDEWTASRKLTEYRSRIPGYRGDSFENISGYGPSGALPHYSTPELGSRVIRRDNMYLIDSGGHYLTGTTDTTRTIPMGECTALAKEDYTLVLKGMIDLSLAVFPKGTTGCHLDILARNPLWKNGRNFGHGTGHGIGYWLCVHEGPHEFRQNFNTQPLLPGMITSVEPALYREGEYGIRHENVLLCRDAGKTAFGEWFSFETLTCCYFDTSAIVPELLGQEALGWLNEYNDWVYRTLSPLLPSDMAAWLRGKTMPV